MNTQKMSPQAVFNKDSVFLIVFIIALLLDVSMKLSPETLVFRYFTKPIATLLMLVYFYFNTENYTSKKNVLIIASLMLFLIADMIFINRGVYLDFNLAIVLMLFAKGCFMYCFFNKKDFKVSRLLPFLLFCFIYLSFILYAIFENLTSYYFVQVMTYFFIALLLALFAFLREGAVNRLSFRLVFWGVLISFISDGLTALNLFSPAFHYNAYTSFIITLSYGVSQYLIVAGLLKEDIQTTTVINDLD